MLLHILCMWYTKYLFTLFLLFCVFICVLPLAPPFHFFFLFVLTPSHLFTLSHSGLPPSETWWCAVSPRWLTPRQQTSVQDGKTSSPSSTWLPLTKMRASWSWPSRPLVISSVSPTTSPTYFLVNHFHFPCSQQTDLICVSPVPPPLF